MGSTITYPAWVTADPRILELAEWLHNRDLRHEAHSWVCADRAERLSYCAEAGHALRFIDSAPGV
jgi:hypothetical protein